MEAALHRFAWLKSHKAHETITPRHIVQILSSTGRSSLRNKSRDKPVCITNLRNNPLNPINHPIFLGAAKLSYYERVNISPYSCSLVHPSIDSHLRRRRTSCITSNYNGWQTRVVMKKKKSRHVNNMISCQLCRHAQGFSSSVSCHQY